MPHVLSTSLFENHLEIITSIKRCLKLSSSQLLSKTEGPFSYGYITTEYVVGYYL